MKAVILAGGVGSRLSEETTVRPKPMVEIGDKPILWHIMKSYAAHGLSDFVICLGYKGYVIKEWFANYALHTSDVTFDLRSGDMEVHHSTTEPWRVTLVETGEATMTGGRLKRVLPYVGDETFCFTYGDGLSDVDIPRLLEFHASHGRAATVTGVRPPSRFGELVVDGPAVQRFSEKPVETGHINGGFFAFKRRFLDFLDDDDACVLERGPLEQAAATGELMMFEHAGYWQCMDTYRDLVKLEEAWNSGRAPWRTW
jgi:glucose-1-phosphate cytidylyltransferase